MVRLHVNVMVATCNGCMYLDWLHVVTVGCSGCKRSPCSKTSTLIMLITQQYFNINFNCENKNVESTTLWGRPRIYTQQTTQGQIPTYSKSLFWSPHTSQVKIVVNKEYNKNMKCEWLFLKSQYFASWQNPTKTMTTQAILLLATNVIILDPKASLFIHSPH